MKKEKSKLFDYFLNRIDHWERGKIKTEDDLIKHYEDNIIIRDKNDYDSIPDCDCVDD